MFSERAVSLEEATRSLHDAEIIEIKINRKTSLLQLTFGAIGAETWRIEFQNFSALRAVDLIHQNVVSRLLVSSIFRFSREELLNWIRWVNSLTSTKSMISDQQVENYYKKIVDNDLILFVIEPSWGAEFVIICENISVFQSLAK